MPPRPRGKPVPLHLRNAVTPLLKGVGYGEGYRYVHEDPAAAREMPCLPESLAAAITCRDSSTTLAGPLAGRVSNLVPAIRQLFSTRRPITPPAAASAARR